MPAKGLMQAVNQVRMTNIAVVRYKAGGKRFEVACYKNKIVNWRSGVETDIKEVLQADVVFENVSKGILAKKKDLKNSFSTSDQMECCKIILRKGIFQVSEKEREQNLESLYRDIATIVSSKCVHKVTRRPFPVETILKAMKDFLHYAPKTKKSPKQQALEVSKLLEHYLPIERARMRIVLTISQKSRPALCEKINELKVEIEKINSDTIQVLLKPHLFRQLSTLIQDLEGSIEVLETSVQNTDATNLVDVDTIASVQNSITEEPSVVNYTTNVQLETPAFKCTTCQLFFDTLESQRLHFKSELHRINLKLKMKNLAIISQELFEIMTVADKEQILYDYKAN